MILKFPQSFPDETFYSWVARYHDQSANVLPQATIAQIYGDSGGCAIFGMPTGLEQFCENLLPLIIYSPEEILVRHTLLPYFSSVLTPERFNNARDKMLQPSNAGAQGQLGILASTIKNFRYLRYCPDCLESDREHMGEAYWHRVHQVPGVLLCPFHHVPTMNSLVDKQNTQHQLYASAERYSKPALRQKNVAVDNRLLSVAEASAELLVDYQKPLGPESYRHQLLKAGFDHGTTINQKKLADEFIGFWGKERLEQLSITTDLRSKSNWLRFITRRTERGSLFQPLQHILVRLFINELNNNRQPAAMVARQQMETQYPCPNPFCNQAENKSASLQQTHRQLKNGQQYGVIACQCGFSFSANLEADKLYTGHVLSYGDLWKEQFIAYIRSGYSLPEMIKAMSVSRGTILRKVNEYELQPSWPVKIKEKNGLRSRMATRKKRERQAFLNYRKQYPEHSRSEIRSGMYATYKFLLRQDQEWLESQLPPVRKPAPRKERIDWRKRDAAYLAEAKNIVSELLSMPGKPKRITPSIISKILGKKNLFTKICRSKIPRTIAYLDEVCHRNHHHKRRLLWAKGQLVKRGKTITRSNLIYTACLSYNLTAFQEALLEQLVEAGNDKIYESVNDCTGKT